MAGPKPDLCEYQSGESNGGAGTLAVTMIGRVHRLGVGVRPLRATLKYFKIFENSFLNSVFMFHCLNHSVKIFLEQIN